MSVQSTVQRAAARARYHIEAGLVLLPLTPRSMLGLVLAVELVTRGVQFSLNLNLNPNP